ncbi:hypothetical protein [Telmatospirillum sp. J64-1]|uniref:hypothetical protein n=1 Tax=Telmatospirillum sp. J64-1 TaxID=2502183 RepID=UPI00115D5A63|nr:hypothetical protein [Telmatospirillum sp. J64-1]
MTREDTIAAAAEAAFNEDRFMVVGLHPYFGWVYRDAEDTAALAELTEKVKVNSDGEMVD